MREFLTENLPLWTAAGVGGFIFGAAIGLWAYWSIAP